LTVPNPHHTTRPLVVFAPANWASPSFLKPLFYDDSSQTGSSPIPCSIRPWNAAGPLAALDSYARIVSTWTPTN